MDKLTILFAAFEAEPLAKTGGLGDVCGSLPRALNGKNCDVRVIMPKHHTIPPVFKQQLRHLTDFKVQLAWRSLYCGVETLSYEGVIFYFIDNEYYYKREQLYGYDDDGERTAFFSKAVLEALKYLDWKPDIIHSHDWHAALIPVYLRAEYKINELYSGIKSVFTIHNLKFQGIYSPYVLGDLLGIDDKTETAAALRQFDTVNYLRGALVCSDRITTVSPSYSDEIKTEYYGERQQDILNARSDILSGILNGIDPDKFNPSSDSSLYQQYSKDSFELKLANKKSLQKDLGLYEQSEAPLAAIISRLTEQKGLDLVIRIIDDLMYGSDGLQLVVIGIGDRAYEAAFRYYSDKYRGRIVYCPVFDEGLSHKVYAGSDMILVPSKFEPCGLTQMIAMRYGTVPIVRETGGLKDSVIPYNRYNGEGTGFSFKNYNAHELLDTIRSASSLFLSDRSAWNRLALHIMEQDFSWSVSAEKYKQLYKTLLVK